MKDLIKEKRKSEYFTGLLFTGAGLLFIIIGIIIVCKLYYSDNIVYTKGTIKDIIYDTDNNQYKTYISYEVNGERYQSILNFSSAKFYEGKTINIGYDKNNVQEIWPKFSDLSGLIMILFLTVGIGGIGSTVGLYTIVSMRRKNDHKKQKGEYDV